MSASLLNHLERAAAQHLPTALDWLQRLVSSNSFTTNSHGVETQAQLTAEGFASLGFQPEWVPSTHPDHGPHLFLRRRPRSAPRFPQPIVLVTHLDTVFPAEEECRNQFQWRHEPETDRIYGPGTVDNKGGTALIWLMLQMLHQVAPDFLDQTDLLIAANAAEEVIGSDFALRTAERCPEGAHCILVFEGGPIENERQYHLVTARKGRLELRIDCHGRAAHAGSKHHEGINAVVALAEFLPRVAALTNAADQLTVNIATIQGGTVLNRVPHHAVAELEMRAYDPRVLAKAEADLHQLATQFAPSAATAQIEITCCGRTQAWPGGPGTEALFALWQQIAPELGIEALAMPRGGLSDANYLHHLGPTLDALGPFGANAHCSEYDPASGKYPEFVQPSSFAPKAIWNCLALLNMR